MLCNALTFFFFTITVSLGFSVKDEDIQGGMKRKRKKCSDQDKAGELKKLGDHPASFVDICLSEFFFSLGIGDRIFRFGVKRSQNSVKLELEKGRKVVHY